MKVCVTGGAGFIGSHLVDRLVADGHEVSVLDDLSSGSRDNLVRSADRLRFVEGDVRDPHAVREAFEGAQVVFHQAARASVVRSLEDPAGVTDVNVAGTVQVLVGARDAGARRVVFASSSSVYGDTDVRLKAEDLPLRPRSPYAASKAAGEHYLAAFGASFGLEWAALRYFNVYGPRQSPRSAYAAVIPLFVDACLAGRRPTIFGDGLQTRDFTYVADVVEANVRCALVPEAPCAALNVGAGRAHGIGELAARVADLVGARVTPRHAAPRPGDVAHSLADVRRLERAVGWRPTTSLEAGLVRVVEALRADPSRRATVGVGS
jgi:nucleoside-diphosphate-sugar epimerase